MHPQTGQKTGCSTDDKSYQVADLNGDERLRSRPVTAPVLLLGFNRPDRLASLIESLRSSAPQTVRIAVDGPRAGRIRDVELVRACRATAQSVDWTTDVEVLERQVNLGLELAIPDAVSWVLREHDTVIVIEDDVIIGPQFVDFAQSMLARFAADESIMHVSGYNVVPRDQLSQPESPIRLSRIPESLAWATWRRAWQHYDPTLTWALSAPLPDLRRITGTRAGAYRWRQNFSLAERQLISTWAYRWLGSMWSRDGWCVSPNQNLVTYRGYTDGTHTRRRAKWSELPVADVDLEMIPPEPPRDQQADEFLQRKVFAANAFGVALGPLERFALRALRR